MACCAAAPCIAPRPRALPLRWAALALVLVVAACSPAEEERAGLDLLVGRASTAGAEVVVEDGLASVRSFCPGRLELWAQAPTLVVELDLGAQAPTDWTVTVRNALPEAELRLDGAATPVPALTPAAATERAWQLTLPPATRSTLRIGAPDAAAVEPFRVAVVSDVQSAIVDFGDIVALLEEEPGLRFVLSTGDLVEDGERGLLLDFQAALAPLALPFYSTVGNHEQIQGDPADWAELFGRCSFHFGFKGAQFTLLDSASATVAPAVYEWLGGWLDEGADAAHVLLTHLPPLDPVGTRSGSFRSRKEAARFLRLLAQHGVDLTIYGHVHSYYAFSNAGIPAYISGGGGGWPELLDGLGRHFLVLDIDPQTQRIAVSPRWVD